MKTSQYCFDVVHPHTGATLHAEMTYFPGFSGSYWQPPEPDEIDGIVRDATGAEVEWGEDEELFALLMGKAGELYSAEMDAQYEGLAEDLKQVDEYQEELDRIFAEEAAERATLH
jgi:hypothetical protein